MSDGFVRIGCGTVLRSKEKIIDIQWTVYGKIGSITKDAAGNRIGKKVEKKGAQFPDTYTWRLFTFPTG